eukprot:CAMPEP_0178747810 /NCGR_PEP_ID=MMETSP0744-20121128/8539_1 /TAXON_ID=913974 /ORGANISM="Nitzschia punctata, Strain CCMP561" /LENGTH=643 /DNA_ID=CAMNT_0020401109 /DNA_START=27 /DNA_END=1958 /DNA_ORIENTATION=-
MERKETSRKSSGHIYRRQFKKPAKKYPFTYSSMHYKFEKDSCQPRSIAQNLIDDIKFALELTTGCIPCAFNRSKTSSNLCGTKQQNEEKSDQDSTVAVKITPSKGCAVAKGDCNDDKVPSSPTVSDVAVVDPPNTTAPIYDEEAATTVYENVVNGQNVLALPAVATNEKLASSPTATEVAVFDPISTGFDNSTTVPPSLPSQNGATTDAGKTDTVSSPMSSHKEINKNRTETQNKDNETTRVVAGTPEVATQNNNNICSPVAALAEQMSSFDRNEEHAAGTTATTVDDILAESDTNEMIETSEHGTTTPLVDICNERSIDGTTPRRCSLQTTFFDDNNKKQQTLNKNQIKSPRSCETEATAETQDDPQPPQKIKSPRSSETENTAELTMATTKGSYAPHEDDDDGEEEDRTKQKISNMEMVVCLPTTSRRKSGNWTKTDVITSPYRSFFANKYGVMKETYQIPEEKSSHSSSANRTQRSIFDDALEDEEDDEEEVDEKKVGKEEKNEQRSQDSIGDGDDSDYATLSADSSSCSEIIIQQDFIQLWFGKDSEHAVTPWQLVLYVAWLSVSFLIRVNTQVNSQLNQKKRALQEKLGEDKDVYLRYMTSPAGGDDDSMQDALEDIIPSIDIQESDDEVAFESVVTN